MERVQRDEYVVYVSKRKILQPAAQQVERVQSDEYVQDVLERRLLQPAAPRSLVPRRVRIGMTGSTFFGLDLAICDLAIS